MVAEIAFEGMSEEQWRDIHKEFGRRRARIKSHLAIISGLNESLREYIAHVKNSLQRPMPTQQHESLDRLDVARRSFMEALSQLDFETLGAVEYAAGSTPFEPSDQNKSHPKPPYENGTPLNEWPLRTQIEQGAQRWRLILLAMVGAGAWIEQGRANLRGLRRGAPSQSAPMNRLVERLAPLYRAISGKRLSRSWKVGGGAAFVARIVLIIEPRVTRAQIDHAIRAVVPTNKKSVAIKSESKR